MKIVEHVSLWYSGASFGYMPGSGIAGTSGRAIPNFLRVAVQFAIPPAMKEGSSFSTALTTCAVTLVFDLSHSDWFKVESQGLFDLV